MSTSVSVLKRLDGPFGMNHLSAEHFTHRVLTFLYTICERLHNSEAEINKCTVGFRIVLYVWGHWTPNKVPLILIISHRILFFFSRNTGISLGDSNEWHFYFYKCPKQKHPYFILWLSVFCYLSAVSVSLRFPSIINLIYSHSSCWQEFDDKLFEVECGDRTTIIRAKCLS